MSFRGFHEDVLTVALDSHVMAGWLAVVVALFDLPLAAFAAPSRRLKQATLGAAALKPLVAAGATRLPLR